MDPTCYYVLATSYTSHILATNYKVSVVLADHKTRTRLVLTILSKVKHSKQHESSHTFYSLHALTINITVCIQIHIAHWVCVRHSSHISSSSRSLHAGGAAPHASRRHWLCDAADNRATIYNPAYRLTGPAETRPTDQPRLTASATPP